MDDEIEGWFWTAVDKRTRKLDGAEVRHGAHGRWEVWNPHRNLVALGADGGPVTFGSAVEACEAVDVGEFEKSDVRLLGRFER